MYKYQRSRQMAGFAAIWINNLIHNDEYVYFYSFYKWLCIIKCYITATYKSYTLLVDSYYEQSDLRILLFR